MTKEEAETLGAGDIISGPFSPQQRTIVQCVVRHNRLHWSEQIRDRDLIHSWPYADMQIVAKKLPTVNNNYSIF